MSIDNFCVFVVGMVLGWAGMKILLYFFGDQIYGLICKLFGWKK